MMFGSTPGSGPVASGTHEVTNEIEHSEESESISHESSSQLTRLIGNTKTEVQDEVIKMYTRTSCIPKENKF